MKIGIDARFYGPRVGGGGIGRYVAELVTHLQNIDEENEYVLFLKKDNFHACKITNPRFYKRLVDTHWYGFAEQRVMPKEIKLAGVDFMHFPHWNIPIFSRVPFVVTIHDLILIEDQHSARSSTNNPILHGFKYAAFRTVLETAIHKSKQIITVSRASKTAITKHFSVKPEKVTVIHNGIVPKQDASGVRLAALGVLEPFFLYVGNAYPHKNLETLMDAFLDFTRHTPHVQLVIAGRRDIFSKKLEAYAYEIGIPRERLRFLNLPTDQEIAALYQAADLFIYPSRLEGFGMPPLEAMQYGTPVAAARASSLPEVLGQAAHYFDPDDREALTAIMTLAAEHPQQAQKKIEIGKKQAASFSWREAAQETLSVYNDMRLRR